MKHVVADTNVLVSALQFGGKPKQLLDLATDGQVDLAISEAIIAETLRVLRDKFHRAPEWVAEADRQLRVITRFVQPTESVHVIQADPTDDRILECAVAVETEVIVSGDTHLLSLGRFVRRVHSRNEPASDGAPRHPVSRRARDRAHRSQAQEAR